MAHFDSGFFFLVGNISIIAWGRSFLLRYDRSISGSTAVRSNQPHRIESRDQTDPHTGQSTVHIKDQRKSSTCMERQQRHSVEFRLITLCVIFFIRNCVTAVVNWRRLLVEKIVELLYPPGALKVHHWKGIAKNTG